MKKELWIAYVDDWELKGNGLGDVETHQYIPSQKLMNIYDECGIKSSFNIEVMQQIAFEKYKDQYPDINRQYSLWLKSVESMINRGYDIQLHLHPQWHNATFDGSYWKLDKRWNIVDYAPEEMRKFVSQSATYLKKILNGRQTIRSFRAGSWAIVSSERSSRPLMEALEEEGILLEISICNGSSYNGESVQLDYQNLTCPYSPYFPDYDDPRKVSSFPTKLVEIPTQSVPRSFFIKVTEKLLHNFAYVVKGPHLESTNTHLPEHIVMNPFGCATGLAKEDRVFDVSSGYHPVLFYAMSYVMINRAMKTPGNVAFLVLENHTKNLQSEEQFQKIKNLILFMKRNWGKRIRFVTLQEMANHLSLIRPTLKNHSDSYASR